jgi:hypothetical protein
MRVEPIRYLELRVTVMAGRWRDKLYPLLMVEVINAIKEIVTKSNVSEHRETEPAAIDQLCFRMSKSIDTCQSVVFLVLFPQESCLQPRVQRHCYCHPEPLYIAPRSIYRRFGNHRNVMNQLCYRLCVSAKHGMSRRQSTRSLPLVTCMCIANGANVLV